MIGTRAPLQRDIRRPDPLSLDRNRRARSRVVDYYRECWDDYRILWRTDETASVHFGFFDRPHRPLWRYLLDLAQGLSALASAFVGGLLGLVRGRESALPWLRSAARGWADRHDEAQRRMTDECARAVGLRPGERVLDAGCGVGGAGLRLAEKHGVRVHGVNVHVPHVREALRNKHAHPHGDRIGFSLQDFTQLALADGSVDVVWALESVCHCEEKDDFVREAYRVLRPGGRLMVADFFRAKENLSTLEAGHLRIWTQGWALPGLASVQGFEASLSERGFRDVRSRDVASQILPSSRRLYKASLAGLPVNALLQATGVRSPIAAANVRAAHWQYRTLRSGVWTYRIFTAVR